MTCHREIRRCPRSPSRFQRDDRKNPTRIQATAAHKVVVIPVCGLLLFASNRAPLDTGNVSAFRGRVVVFLRCIKTRRSFWVPGLRLERRPGRLAMEKVREWGPWFHGSGAFQTGDHGLAAPSVGILLSWDFRAGDCQFFEHRDSRVRNGRPAIRMVVSKAISADASAMAAACSSDETEKEIRGFPDQLWDPPKNGVTCHLPRFEA